MIVALGYVFTPVVPVIVLAGDLGRDERLRRHAWQALIWTIGFALLLGAAIVIAILLLRADFLAICLLPFLISVPFVPGAIWAWRAYLGKPVRIRGISPIAVRLATRARPD